MKTAPPYFLCILGIAALAVTAAGKEPASSKYRFLPPPGKTFLMIGQDKRAIDDYVKAVRVIPAGVMVYTSIQKLSGLSKASDNGAGVHHAAYLARQYPHSALQIGLYMVNALYGINNGDYDRNIDRLAEWIKDQKQPVYLRIGYEFDNPDNDYSPPKYRKAFRRIVERFRALDVDNVAFVWHSGAFLGVNRSPMDWFPGADYVDWIAASLFSPSQFEKVKTLASIAGRLGKPFMIAETSPMGTFSVNAKLDWYDKLFRIIEKLRPQAVCYINTDWDTQPMFKDKKYGDARVQETPEIKAMWLDEIRAEHFIHAAER